MFVFTAFDRLLVMFPFCFLPFSFCSVPVAPAPSHRGSWAVIRMAFHTLRIPIIMASRWLLLSYLLWHSVTITLVCPVDGDGGEVLHSRSWDGMPMKFSHSVEYAVDLSSNCNYFIKTAIIEIRWRESNSQENLHGQPDKAKPCQEIDYRVFLHSINKWFNWRSIFSFLSISTVSKEMVHSAFESIRLELELEWHRFNQIAIVCVKMFEVSKHYSSYYLVFVIIYVFFWRFPIRFARCHAIGLWSEEKRFTACCAKGEN